jgi:hypothetical protein
LTVKEAYRIHRTAARNCGRGKGYTARRLDEALPVLEAFWTEVGSTHITKEMVEDYDRRHHDSDTRRHHHQGGTCLQA